jgi:hypothetical protein
LIKPHDQPRAAFVVHFVAEPGVDAIKAIRRLLKIARRHLGLHCTDARECEHARVRLSSRSRLTREHPMSAFSEKIRGKESGFFKVADLENGERTLSISHLDEDVVLFGEVKDVLNFVETGKQLQLNQTVSEWLLDNLGDDPASWEGKKVVLHLGEYTYNKEKKLGVRLKLPGAPEPKPAIAAAPKPAPAPRGGNGSKSDPDIPF